MAYPFGHSNEHIAEVIRKNTGGLYSRTIRDTKNFDLQDDLFQFNPSVYYIKVDEMFRLGREFLALTPDTPKLFYVWGHTYEMDAEYITWEKFEEFCAMMANKDDIFYGTNAEVLL